MNEQEVQELQSQSHVFIQQNKLQSSHPKMDKQFSIGGSVKMAKKNVENLNREMMNI